MKLFQFRPAFLPTRVPTRRLSGLDLARGLAVLAMVLYHLSWDLGYFQISPIDLAGSDIGRLAAHAIATSFLALVGISLVLAQNAPDFKRKFWRRQLIIGASAAAISLVTFIAMPDSWIFFGILHCIFLASLIGFALLDASPLLLIGLSVVALVLPLGIASSVFNPLPLVWLGLSETLPSTNDFAPLFPSIAAVLAGMVFTKLKLQPEDFYKPFANDNAPKKPAFWLKRGLLWCGRHSLAIYLIHQPLLFGAFMLTHNVANVEARFEAECQTQCIGSGAQTKICAPACSCMRQELKTSGLWTKLVQHTLDEEGRTAMADLALMCGQSAKDLP